MHDQPPAPPDQKPKRKIDYSNPIIVKSIQKYWERNIRVMGILLLIWAAAGLGCGILFADWLNQFNFPGTGYPLGFWFAQQGAIIIFVIIILIYALTMNKIDNLHKRELDELHTKSKNNDGGVV
ncbi:hypothetical protein KS4_09290 [Poriferisphaera corsica]|uniref:Sodium symporter small subunit domain-containing protein n=1 Tax=Poriferisphaera corsica TaxID=2528020 RepID=A0A517YRP1_9BACT|nr:DUF4212 domain-containing protein [Poriferisphaera corsica]QDU32890.1 hypothetical protein KS4_09290 [Poriferisphaera corsica]